MWQKQQQVGSHMSCAPFVTLVKWKVWKRPKRVCWSKITVIYNSRNVFQTKDIQPWSESLKSVWVIEKSYSCALAHCSCKNTQCEEWSSQWIFQFKQLERRSWKLWSPCDRRCHSQNYFWQELYQRYLNLAVAALASVWAGCVELITGHAVSESGTENILASDSSSEPPRPP